jgi:glucoside 3-dehydrogenase (cytochrome c) hitch-hiker subunit
MKRRDVLKLLGTAAVGSALPHGLWAFGRTLQSQIAAGAGLRTLDAHQNATVIAISEMIIPQTDTPGAQATRVNEFIDLILTDWYAPQETHRFLEGLAKVDARCHQLFTKDFVACTESQQAQILTALDADILAQRALKKPGNDDHAQQETPQHFFYMMKQLTVVGYCTSEAGAQAVGYEAIPTEHTGCAPVAQLTTTGRG